MTSKYIDIASLTNVIGCVYSDPKLLDATDKYFFNELVADSISILVLHSSEGFVAPPTMASFSAVNISLIDSISLELTKLRK